eukprot:CAMPEP_0184645152 /NCGR_PEP_ID=MMETSP0308-20130426/1687_1 /TAXON_ID=38269 /ORGANISM="Gloeochaete witrockiana, Strain SAG 46.84" /LENGTH=326 /DNA_ID=CAMNT_0027073995 /DNA_START=368 /DNA_END=1345 /DNA_ORIENTATION=+
MVSTELPKPADCISQVFASYDEALKDHWGGASVDLIIRSFRRDASLLLMLFRSIDLYWPKNIGNIIVVLDEGEEYFARSLFPHYVKVYYSMFPPAFRDKTGGAGYIGQQIFYLWCDNFTTSDYVAIIDADAAFVTKVTPDLLFRSGNPIVIGAKKESQYRLSTSWFLGDSYYVANFMLQLPMIFPAELFPAIRKHILQVHPEVPTVDQVAELYLKQCGGQPDCFHLQFSLLANYYYTSLRDRGYFLFEGEEDSEPALRVMAHIGHLREVVAATKMEKSHFATFDVGMKLISDGLCYSFPEGTLPNCNHTNGRMQEILWEFEFGDLW